MTSPVEQILAEGGYATDAEYLARLPTQGLRSGFVRSDSDWRRQYIANGLERSSINESMDTGQTPDWFTSYEGNPEARQTMLDRWGGTDFAYHPEARAAIVLDAQGNEIEGSQFSTTTNDDATFTAGLLGLGGVGALSATGAGAAVGGGAATGSGAGGLTSAEAGVLMGGGEAVGGVGAGVGAGGAGAGSAAAGGVGASGVPELAGAGGTIPPVAAGPGAGPSGGGNWWDSLLSGMGSGAGSMGMRDWLSILSGVYGMNLASNARDEMDPFRGQRPYYQQRLAELEQNPSLITQRPGWRAGTEAITREMASRGYMGGGNHAVGLQRFGGDFYNQEMNRLAGLAGAGATPGAGTGAYTNLIGQSLGSIGYGLAPYGQNRPRVGTGGSYFGGGYTNPADDPAGTNGP